MLQAGLLKNSFRSLHLIKVQEKPVDKHYSLACSLWYHPTRRLKYKVKWKSEPQEYDNTKCEIDEKDLYELDKLSLDDSKKERPKRKF